MSVANILDDEGKIRPQYIPNIVENKIKALEEFVRIVSEAIEIEGYTYNGDYQGIYDNIPDPEGPTEPEVTEPEPEVTEPEPEPEVIETNVPEVPTEPESSG
jgi:hypothetical protein